MPDGSLSELYFIAGMMILIMIVSVVSVYFFFKTYYKEKKGKELAAKRKAESVNATEKSE